MDKPSLYFTFKYSGKGNGMLLLKDWGNIANIILIEYQIGTNIGKSIW
jgi:hypothetical protein